MENAIGQERYMSDTLTVTKQDILVQNLPTIAGSPDPKTFVGGLRLIVRDINAPVAIKDTALGHELTLNPDGSAMMKIGHEVTDMSHQDLITRFEPVIGGDKDPVHELIDNAMLHVSVETMDHIDIVVIETVSAAA